MLESSLSSISKLQAFVLLQIICCS